MRVFVPVEDAPSSASIPMLVPYQCGVPCEHALRIGPDQVLASAWRTDSGKVNNSVQRPNQAFVETR